MGIIRQKKTFSIDNEIIDNSERIANEFNNFFRKLVNVGSLVLSSTSLYLLVLATVFFL